MQNQHCTHGILGKRGNKVVEQSVWTIFCLKFKASKQFGYKSAENNSKCEQKGKSLRHAI